MPAHFFTAGEVIEATGGALIIGEPDELFTGISIDSRTLKKGDIFICINGERFDGHDFIPEAIAKGASCIIFSRYNVILLGSTIPHSLIAVGNTLGALSDLAYYHRKRFAIPVIGITGSNGKTTTKEMISRLLSSKYKVLKNEGTQNNSIGLSLTLLNLRHHHEMAVLELGTNHFGEIRELARIAAPSVGVITNIGPAHLEFFGDEGGVLKEKWDLVEELAWPRIAILNGDDPLLRERPSGLPGDVTFFTFGIHHKADIMAQRVRRGKKKISFYVKRYPCSLTTVSRVNIYNALAAYTVARLFSVDAYDIIKGFQDFAFPKARFQMKKVKGMTIIDDAYNANPASFRCALDAFHHLPASGRKIMVMADMMELGNRAELFHQQMGEALSKTNVNVIVGIGPLSQGACDAAQTCGFNPRSIFRCSSLEQARNIISAIAKKNDTILLKGSRAMKLEDLLT